MGLAKPSRIFFHGGYQGSSGGDRGSGACGGSSGGRRRRQPSIRAVHGHASAEIRRIHVRNRVRSEGQVLLQQQQQRSVVAVRYEALALQCEFSDLRVQTQGRRDLAPHR